jgi:putative transposase
MPSEAGRNGSRSAGWNPAASTTQTFHVWFSTKYRQPALVGEIAEAVESSLRSIAERTEVRILEMMALEDHVHLLLTLAGNQRLSTVMHDLKGASAREIFQRFPELRIDMRSNSFWQRGYGWRAVPLSQIETVRNYIRTQPDRPLRHHE